MGEARPGLRWWFDAGKPTDDPRLQLIAEVWDADGQLDWFAAWLWTTGHLHVADQFAQFAEHSGDGIPVAIDDAWVRRVSAQAANSGITTPIGGGSDPLHLSMHCNGPLADVGGKPQLLRSRATERRAVLVLDSMLGWYRALLQHGAMLPELAGRSWNVDVVVRPVGCLGTFRRSRASGLWFSGRHRHHIVGV